MRKKPQVAVITNFSTYEPRAEEVGKFFLRNGADVEYIFSDFLHREKIKRNEKKQDHTYLTTEPYTKNISIQRMVSHYRFAKDLKKFLSKKQYDLIYILIPANSLLLAAKSFKKMRNAKLIVDVIDLWPESMIPEKFINMPILKQWRQIREKNLKYADWVFTECDLYNNTLSLGEQKHSTLYWEKGPIAYAYKHEISNDILEVAYIGSINNIIDIDFICKILRELNARIPVKVNIIGDGEKREQFIFKLRQENIEVKFYGSMYNDNDKENILRRCSFGLNIMKEKTSVGLTMKSVDYFYFGIPIINNIPGDTRAFINKYNIGINVTRLNYKDELKKAFDDSISNASQIQSFYNSKFTHKAFNEVLDIALSSMLID